MAITQTNLLTTSKITKESLMQLLNNLVIASKADWSYSEQFANPVAQIGDSLSIRRPLLPFIREDSMTFSGALPVESSVVLTVDKIFGADLKFTDVARTLQIEQFAERFIKPSVSVLAAKLDNYVYGKVINGVSNTVGQYNTAITTDTILNAKEILDSYSCPMDDEIYGILTPRQNRNLSNYQMTLFNAQKAISDIYTKGRIGEFAGVEWATSQSSPTHYDGTWAGTPTIGTNVAGNLLTSGWAETASLTINGLTAGATLNEGDVFTISGVYAYSPLNKATLPFLQQFVVTKAVTSATATNQTVVAYPAIITSGDYKNVDITIVGASVAVTKYSTSGTFGQEGIVFHKKAIAIASPMLYKPSMTVKSESIKDEDTNINIRYTEGFDITNSTDLNRLDTILGVKVVRPEWACRIRGG